jgi:type VI secretion system secreted protein Hcp
MKKMMFTLFTVLAFSFFTSLMAQGTKTFMNMGNDIKGSATQEGFKDNLAILSYSQGASSCPQVFNGAGSGACKVSSSDFSFMMEMDRSIIKLKEYIYNGKIIPQVVISFIRTGGEGLQNVYYKITLTNVLISSLQESGSSEKPIISFSLSPTTMAWEFTPQDDKGGPGTPLQFSWDNVKSRSF